MNKKKIIKKLWKIVYNKKNKYTPKEVLEASFLLLDYYIIKKQ